MNTQSIYQYLYDCTPKYGRPNFNSCPGISFYPYYEKWLEAPIMDLGCGTGDTVIFMRKNNLSADGMDQVIFHPQMLVGDICDPLPEMSRYATGLCIDVIEHIHDDKVFGLLSNLGRCKKQIISIHNKPAEYRGPNGEELHVNLKPFSEWKAILDRYFEVCREISVSEVQTLYLCKAHA
jgi:hypothetical protein